MSRLPLALLAFALVAGCQPTAETPAETPLAGGAELYQIHCQGCHGASAQGDGPIADMLKITPADLTTIAARNNGNFPVDELVAWIDGRAGEESHGSREMPVWGNVWTDSEGGADREQEVSQQINELVEYLRTLQAEE